MLPHAIQYGMTVHEFWHGDMRLLEAYQTAYFRKVSYEKWLEGQYSLLAFGVTLSNAFAKKGTPQAKYPNWEDPMQKISKPKITHENIEDEFRKEQINQQSWLFHK